MPIHCDKTKGCSRFNTKPLKASRIRFCRAIPRINVNNPEAAKISHGRSNTNARMQHAGNTEHHQILKVRATFGTG